MTSIELFQKIADRAREYAKEEQSREFGQLDGACHENAIGAAEYIHKSTNFTPYITWGMVHPKSSKIENPPEEISEIENSHRSIHLWAEIRDVEEDDWIIIDISSINRVWSESEFGDDEAIAIRGIPEEYHRPKKSRFKYEDWIRSNYLISVSGYEELQENGVVFTN